MNKKVLHTLFEKKAEEKPNNIAVQTDEKSYTYKDLNEQANCLGQFLNSTNIGKDDIVTVFLENNFLQLISLIGIFKSGAIYLPLDKKYNYNHWEELYTRIKPTALLVSEETIDIVNQYQNSFDYIIPNIILIDNIDQKLKYKVYNSSTNSFEEINNQFSSNNLEIEVDGDDSNYIFFTSGSTGKPKAVLGTHKSLSHFIHWESKELNIDEKIRVAQLTSLSFDASLRDIFLPLINGGRICFPNLSIKEDAPLLLSWLDSNKISLLHTIPSMLRLLCSVQDVDNNDIPKQFKHLDYILLAGEKLFVKDIKAWRTLFGTNTTFFNLYGATESTLIKSFYKIEDNLLEDLSASIPVGQPISNTKILIINSENQICKINEIGSIYIRTPFLSKGYYNNPIQTAEKFIQNPLINENEIIYKTGDFGKYNHDRNIIVLGREDGLVKINGVRVDLNSIENVINSLEEIQVVKCILDGESSIDNVLICFYKSNSIAEKELREYCLKYLSAYEMPSIIHKLNEFPINSNGKIDVEKLKVTIKSIKRIDKIAEKPINPIQQKIVEFFQEVLNVENIGILDSFTAYGGHSLKGIQLLNRIQKEFGVRLSLKDIFELENVQEISKKINQGSEYFEEIPIISTESYYKVSNSQKRMWLSSLKKENASLYNVPLKYKIVGEIDFLKFNDTFLKLIEKHETLRTVFKFVDGNVHQFIIPFDEIEFKIVRLKHIKNLNNFILEEGLKPFALDKEILIRVKLIEVSNSESILLITLNHIVYDGWSRGILQNEILTIYNSILNNTHEIDNNLKVNYKDYVYWHENKYLNQEAFWENFFQKKIEPLNFPLDFERPKRIIQKGIRLESNINGNEYYEIKENLKKLNINKTDYFISIFGLLLYEYCDQKEFLIGTVLSGRTHIDLEKIIGVFINYLPLKININQDITLQDYIEKQSKSFLQVYENQDYPFDLIVEKFVEFNDNSRNPVFDTTIILHNNESVNDKSITKNTIEIYDYEVSSDETVDVASIDFKIDVVFYNEEVIVYLEYNTILFKNQTMELFLEEYIHYLKILIKKFDSPIEKIIQIKPNDWQNEDYNEIII